MKSLIIFSFVFILIHFLAISQNHTPAISKQVGDYYREISFKSEQRTFTKIDTNWPTTALAVSIDLNTSFQNAYLEVDNQIYPLVSDLHVEEKETRQYSQLIHFDQKISEVSFHSGEITGDVRLLLINGKPNKPLPYTQKPEKVLEDCLEPASIDQSVWRNGLSSPSYTRSFTKVEHIIVHHSAGSNSATDYTQVVREIFIFHTEGRGWSDIGYNYLIAQDGSIFKGRDPDNGEQDNVIGAHFCGGNSATMGICLLGDYNLATPNTQILSSLESLITWKLKKENLDPLGFSSHPLNSNLGSIGGHRDGCATECPGNNTYDLLSDIRQNVLEQLIACGESFLIADFSVSDSVITEGESILFSNLSIGEPEFYLWTFEGGEPSTSTSPNPTVNYPTAGVYGVSLTITVNGKQIVLNREAFVTVEAKKEVAIYPNPSRGLSIKIANIKVSEVKEVYFVDSMGKRIRIMNPEKEGDVLAISISQLSQGIYLLCVVFENRLIKERVLVL